MKETVVTETWKEVIDNLDESDYGGMYLIGDVLHIKPVDDTENMSKIIDNAKTKTRALDSNDIVIDSIAELSPLVILLLQQDGIT